jgi:hypothetical protein
MAAAPDVRSTPLSAAPKRSPAKLLLFSLVMLSLPVLALALLEGVSSLVLIGHALTHPRALAETRHTERDTLLGWINRPNLSIPDMYGPGIGLHTNHQRVRQIGDLAPRPPEGRRRLVCSGDSFTLGYGVSDGQTWCSLLGAHDTLLETVNMGQGGYGVDQAFLWYLRDGMRLHPDVHVLALITEDLLRMMPGAYRGYPKPHLALNASGLHTVGVPVPTPGLMPWIATLANQARSLRSFELLQRLHLARAEAPTPRNVALLGLALAVLRDLARKDSAAGIELLVVHLPTRSDFNSLTADLWLQQAREAARRGAFRFVDLIEPFRRLPLDSVERMFIKPGEIPFAGAAGHFNIAGNAWVAKQLTSSLRRAAR